MREQFLCGLKSSLSMGPRTSSSGLTDHDTNLSLLIPRSFLGERVAIILLAVLLPIEIGCGEGSVHQMTASGGAGGAVHQYATGNAPTSVATGDFNQDKILDLAVINGTDNTVSVLLGNGDGTFRQRVDYPADASALAVADFNGDGKQDLVTGGGLLLGNGDGTFQAMVPLPGGGDNAVALGDLNGDGKPDLVFIGWILLGNGNGTFQVGNRFLAEYDCCVAIGDINGDGKLDVVLSSSSFNGSGWVYTYPGNGDGTLSEPEGRSYALLGQFGYGVALNDFNGDGKQDIVTGSAAGVNLLLGNGDGTFQSPTTFATVGYPMAITVADFNADGKPDVAVVNGEFPKHPVSANVNVVSILLGNGDGTLQMHVEYPTGTTPKSVVDGDFNDDGKLDLAVTNQDDNTVSILLGNGDGTFKTTW